MKVVLFCGGFGMRMREFSEAIPKPMVPIGYRPILWHVMKYYAHYGHKDFILCLGYKADAIKNYFLQYDECLSNDFVLSKGGKDLELLSRDIDDWKITFVDTGLTSNIGQRLKAVQKHLRGEEMFLANYTDGLSNVQISSVIRSFESTRNAACFVSVKPRASFHLINSDAVGSVKSIEHVAKSGARIVDVEIPDFTFETGFSAVAAFLSEGRRMDALFAGSDTVAMGAVMALKEADLRVPEDVTVIGYNDLPIAQYFQIPLTTIRQDTHHAGSLLVEKLRSTHFVTYSSPLSR